MTFQTTVADPGLGYEGQIAESFGPRDVRSALAEGLATRAIVAGQPVLRGTDPAVQARAILNGDTLDATTLAGWAVLDTTRPPAELAGGADSEGAPVAVMVEGYLWVRVSAAVSAGDPVYVGTATAQLGDVEGAAGAGLTLCPGARFVTSADAAGLAKIRTFPA
jgi:hypothetical protein